ncbi:EamA family transporter [Planctomycetota bacterium]|nr:EamA family transporter [Planctomycetota bacterium]
MLYLVFNIIATVLFFQALRFGQVRKLSEMTVSAVNYAVGAIVTIAILLITHFFFREQHLTQVAFIGGAVMGVVFYAYLFVLFRAYNFFGVGITSALIQIGVTLAAIFAWFAYDEPISRIQWIGLAFIPVALMLMRPSETNEEPNEESDTDEFVSDSSNVATATETKTQIASKTLKKANPFFVLFILVVTALTQTLFAIIHDAVPRFDDNVQDGFLAYTAVIFVFGAICNVAHVLIFERKRHKLATYTVGSVAGLANIGIVFLLVLALDNLSPTVVLPTISVAIIAVNILIARAYWKEPISKIQYIGLASTFLVILLMNYEAIQNIIFPVTEVAAQ